MTGLAILMGAAGVAFGVARLLRTDALPFLLGAGFILSLLPLPLERGLVESAAFLGLAFLVFLAGHELNPHRIAPFGRVAFVAAALRVLGLGMVGFILGTAFGYGVGGALLFALATGSCSLIVGVRLLEDRREFFRPYGRLAAGVLLIQGLFLVLALPFLAAPVDGFGAALPGTAGAVILIAASFAFMRWVSVYLVTHLELNEEVILLVTFAILIAFVLMAQFVGLPFLAGAFMAGIALSRFPVNGIIRGYMKSSSDLAAAMGFTAVGALVTIPRGADLALAFCLIMAVLIVAPALLTLVGGPKGPTARAAFRAGLLVSQTGEFSLVLAFQGVTLGLIEEQALSVIFLVMAATMFLTPILSRENRVWNLLTRLPPWHRAREEDASGHVLMLGFRGADIPLLETIRHAGSEVLVVDDDPGMVAKVRAHGVRSVVGDVSDPAVLHGVGAARARAVVLTVHHPPIAEQVSAQIGDVPMIVRVYSTEAARRARELGAVPVLWADPIAEDFLAWLEDEAEP